MYGTAVLLKRFRSKNLGGVGLIWENIRDIVYFFENIEYLKGKVNLKVLVFGSLNIDYVYSVDHFVQPGETISSTDRQIFCGGKGLN